jgi:hypothetical protein
MANQPFEGKQQFTATVTISPDGTPTLFVVMKEWRKSKRDGKFGYRIIKTEMGPWAKPMKPDGALAHFKQFIEDSSK